MQKTTVMWAHNPSQLYLEALVKLVTKGKELAPRGKRIKELRPVVLEYHNPLNRVTFLKGRMINPFFQLAESLWILSGGSDVKSLTDYNKSIAQFSDDGEYFNAPYGERLRHWGKNDLRGFIFNPIDQLEDCYRKLKADPDTRQAVAFIGNPHFDNSNYTLNGGKDIACNINIKFKIRDGKLDITVDNRSNDLHWGTFGANLCQFATIQEVMASWLGIEVGTYFQETDSLHIYLDDYGAKETMNVLKAYGLESLLEGNDEFVVPFVNQYNFGNEPRFQCGYDEFHEQLQSFYFLESAIDGDTIFRGHEEGWLGYLEELKEFDPYLRMTFQAMFVKRAHNNKNLQAVVDGMRDMEDCSWKVSCLRWLRSKYPESKELQSVYNHFPQDIIDYIERKGE